MILIPSTVNINKSRDYRYSVLRDMKEKVEDKKVLIDASKFYCRVGDFVQAKVFEATDFDLYAPVEG